MIASSKKSRSLGYVGVFWKILRSSSTIMQSFIAKVKLYLKRDSDTGAFLWILRTWEHPSIEFLRKTAFES